MQALVYCHIARQPEPLHEVNEDVPLMISKMVMRLLAKHAEQRYQSARGLLADLTRCAVMYRENRVIELFEPGAEDIPPHFELPQKIYGREGELAMLLAAFERCLEGRPVFLRVAGWSGVGKTALIQELFKPLTQSGGYFVSGKFDQFRGNNACSAIIDALTELARQLLSESDESLQHRREMIAEAVGNNGRLITRAVPVMEKIMGPQPELETVDVEAAHQRFLRTLTRFISSFCEKGRPLILFIDDLQWADPSSRQLMEWLARTADPVPLLVIGAYRDNEVDPGHPLTLTLQKIEAACPIASIDLKPLDPKYVGLLIAEALHRDPEEVAA
ncbi:MAG: AAA family ATPase, partial [Pseudomonadales bacterium]|nr:AAA family ATPase [Pseudomonadales bacterium]